MQLLMFNMVNTQNEEKVLLLLYLLLLGQIFGCESSPISHNDGTFVC